MNFFTVYKTLIEKFGQSFTLAMTLTQNFDWFFWDKQANVIFF